MSNYMKLRKGTKGIKKHEVSTGRLVTGIFFIEKLIYLNIVIGEMPLRNQIGSPMLSE